MSLKNLLFLLSFLPFVALSQHWAWIGGTQNNGHPGNYGSIGVGAASNIPPGRKDFMTATSGDTLVYVFGGTSASGRFNDLWTYDSESNIWTWISGSSSTNQSGVYGTKGVSDGNNVPGARDRASITVDDNGNIWVFGGQGYDESGSVGYLNDLWKYDIASGEWTWMAGSKTIGSAGNFGTINVSAPTNQPPARYWAKSWFYNGKLYMFGGLLVTPANSNDLWSFDTATNEWTWINGSSAGNGAPTYGTKGIQDPSNQIGARNSFDLFDPKDGTIFVFGGFGVADDATGYLNDVWKYDAQDNEWTWVAGSSSRNGLATYGTTGTFDANNIPGSRRYMVNASKGDTLFYVYGGFGKQSTASNVDLSELWLFDAQTYEWAFLKGSTFGSNSINYGTLGQPASNVNPGARKYGSAFFVAPQYLMVFGGDNESNSNKNDLFAIDFCTLTLPAPDVTPITCHGDEDASVTLNATGAVGNYYYSDDDVVYGATNVFSDLPPATYNFYVMDDLNCKKSREVVIEDPDELTAVVSTVEPVLCHNGMASLDVVPSGGTPPYEYSDDNVDFSSDSDFSVGPGSHTFYVNDDNGCETTADVTYVNPAELILDINVVEDMLCKGDKASIELVASGGAGNYTYSDDNVVFNSTTSYNDLSQGSYTYFVKDDNDCEASNNITFSEPGQLVVVGIITHEEQGGSDGAVNINVGGGTSPYTYSWSNGESSQNISGLTAGSYTVTITDANGCEIEETFVVDNVLGTTSFDAFTFDLYPNPSDGFVTFNFGQEGTYSIVVLDASSRIVEEFNIDGNKHHYNHNLNAGIYLVHVFDGANSVVKRFVVR